MINCIHGSSPNKLSISELRTFLSYGHPLVPDCPDKRGLSVLINHDIKFVLQFLFMVKTSKNDCLILNFISE